MICYTDIEESQKIYCSDLVISQKLDSKQLSDILDELQKTDKILENSLSYEEFGQKIAKRELLGILNHLDSNLEVIKYIMYFTKNSQLTKKFLNSINDNLIFWNDDCRISKFTDMEYYRIRED